MSKITSQLNSYTGTNPFLTALKNKIANDEQLNASEKRLAIRLLKKTASTKSDAHKRVSIDWSKYPYQPYKHQKNGISFLIKNERAILGDEMGLGKTFQSIVAAHELKTESVLIVCPNHLKYNWKKEISSFTDHIQVIDKELKFAHFTILNYEKLKKYGKRLKDHNFDVIIVDECHYAKNRKAQRTKELGKLIARRKKPVWFLTGTPISNRPIDFWQLLRFCRHKLTKETKRWRKNDNAYIRFGKRFCNGYQTRFGWDMSGASNLSDLHKQTKDILLRRTKEECLDLPSKQRISICLQLTSFDEYLNVVNEYFNDLYEKSVNPFSESYGIDPFAAEHLVRLSILRKHLAIQKAIDGSTLQLILDILNEEKKVVIFTNYKDVIDQLTNLLKDYKQCKNVSFIDGRVKLKERQQKVDDFQTKKDHNVLIANYVVGNVGWNMTAAEVAIMNDINWSPSVHSQAEDRCIFEGQLIATKNGMIPIEEIKEGDFVYTHEGRWKKVLNTKTHLELKKLRVDIRAKGYNLPLSTTEDHLIYIYDVVETTYKWIQAIDLRPMRHQFVVNIGCNTNTTLRHVAVDRPFKNKFTNNYGIEQKNGRMHITPNKITLTHKILYAFGRYVADGWCRTKKSHPFSIGICGNAHTEKDKIIKVTNDLIKAFNIKKNATIWEVNNAINCVVYSKNLAINFKQWFGEGARNKRFPDWVFSLSKKQVKSLLQGYYDGNGSETKNTKQASTVSSQLAFQLCILKAQLGFNPKMHWRKQARYWSVEYSINVLRECKVKVFDNYIHYPISNIAISHAHRKRVYDLEVEDDHSFVVGLSTVHNCHRIGQEKSVNILYPIYENTLDEVLFDILKTKMAIIDEAIDGKKTSVDTSMLKELQEKLFTMYEQQISEVK